MEFEYDKAKSDSNQAKHGIDFEEAKALWIDPKRVEFVARFSDEPRSGLVKRVGPTHSHIWPINTFPNVESFFACRQGDVAFRKILC